MKKANRKAAARKAKAVKEFNLKPLRAHVVGLAKRWRVEERGIDRAFNANDGKTMRAHEREQNRLEKEMRRIVRTVELFPVWY